ncbi:hypothetical protein DINM_021310 [Dirofilaria immitis]|nr:hypothetical protein [Dirofilaria immitis]
MLMKVEKKGERENFRCCVYDLAFKPDGSELLVAADTKVLIYDGTDGTLLQSLKGHKDLVYAVAFSYNGENFASGSADRSVIIWTEQHEGTLKYIHNEAIQCLAFSPTTCFLLSCATSDFGIWTQLEKSVSKQRTSSRCVCCAWSCDGQLYAIGMFDGTVSLRSAANNVEIKKIERPSGEPVWALALQQLEALRMLHASVTIFRERQTAAFYDLEGNQLVREDKKLGYDPTAVEFFNYGQFLIICGSNRQVTLYSREAVAVGTTLGTVAQMDTWVWTVKARPNTNAIVVGCVDGTLACYQLMFSTVHGLHKERYAYRENMTEVVVRHLINQTSIRIYCNDLVRKVAVYYNRLAVQLANRVEIYRLTVERDDGQLKYKLVEKINHAFECSLLVVCAHHLILCQERRLQCYDHKGLKQREWLLESLIRYIKVVGGPPGREAILIGLRNGAGKLAIVDETGVCSTFDIKTKELLFQEPSCNSVAWNADQENLLCYSGNGALCVKADNFSSHQQRMQGFVVGFSGKRVFCLHMFAMIAMEVPLSNQLYQYLEQKMYKEAYDLASLGVTEGDWDVLGHDALHNFQLDIAQKAFHRIKDARYLQLISEIKDMIKRDAKKELVLGCIKAYEGRYREAAILFQKTGCEQKHWKCSQTCACLIRLRSGDKLELLSSASGETQKALLRRRADWAQNSNEPIIAAEMFIASGDYDKAVTLMIKNDWIDMLINLAHRIDRSNVDAFLVAEKYQKYSKEVYLPYARWLAENDRFDEAQKAEPFTSCPTDALVNIARYLAFQKKFIRYHESILYTLMKQGQVLGAYKLARYALEQLSYLKIPRRFEKLIETDALMIKSKPFTDAEELLPMCYRCGVSNPLIVINECIHCKTPFILSFVSFGQAENPLQEQMNLKIGKVVADREMLLKLEKQQVIIAEWPPPFVTRFYYNMFHADDFEMACLKTGACPFCHVAPQRKQIIALLMTMI